MTSKGRNRTIAARALVVGIAAFVAGELAATGGASAGPSIPPCLVSRQLSSPDGEPSAAGDTRPGEELTGSNGQASVDVAGTLHQSIGLTIRGGDLHIPQPVVAVQLRPSSGDARTLTGEIPPIRVVDARGTHAGWQVEWTIDEVGGNRSSADPDDVVVRPAAIEPVHALPAVLPAAPACAGAGVLATAAPGTGGGTHQVGGTVTLSLEPGELMETAEVVLRFDVS